MTPKMLSSLDIAGEIAKLPIAYYAGRPIDIKLDTEMSNRVNYSAYDLANDCIVIAYSQVAKALSSIDDDEFDPNTDIRPLPYHEVAHAMLTPREMFFCNGNRLRNVDSSETKPLKEAITEIANIFEDERIETILATTFMHVDFKRNVKLVNHYDRRAMPDSAVSLFYHIVRFHYTPFPLKRGLSYYLQRVKQIIMSSLDITASTSNHTAILRYLTAVDRLYLDIRKEFCSGAAQPQTESASSHDDKLTDSSESTDSSDDKSIDSSGEESQSDSKATRQASESNSSSSDDISDIFSDLDVEIIKSIKPFESACRDLISDEAFSLSSNEKISIENCMTSVKWFGYEQDSDIIAEAISIFESKSKRAARSSAAIPCYSGVIEPKLIGRKDWRVWLNKSRGGAYRMWSKTHLNLFIDNSGSFADNRIAVNRLICSLEQVEKRVPEFTFDVVRCGTKFKICDKQHRFCSASEGTRFDESIIKIYNRLQQRGAINYNIMIVDGEDGTTRLQYDDDDKLSPDALSYDYYGETVRRLVICKPYTCFNHATDVIITDSWNCTHIEKQAPRAMIVSMSDREYSSKLIDTVMSCLRQLH